jgi:hypothetical protein
LKFLHFSSGEGCKVCGFIWFIEYIGSDLVDREVGYLVSEDEVQLGDVPKNGHDFGHEAWMYWSFCCMVVL